MAVRFRRAEQRDFVDDKNLDGRKKTVPGFIGGGPESATVCYTVRYDDKTNVIYGRVCWRWDVTRRKRIWSACIIYFLGCWFIF
jgi:hypothetical protein